MNLSLYEQETIINYNEEEATASIYTHNRALIRKLDKFAQEAPGVRSGEGQSRGTGRRLHHPEGVGTHLPAEDSGTAHRRTEAEAAGTTGKHPQGLILALWMDEHVGNETTNDRTRVTTYPQHKEE